MSLHSKRFSMSNKNKTTTTTRKRKNIKYKTLVKVIVSLLKEQCHDKKEEIFNFQNKNNIEYVSLTENT